MLGFTPEEWFFACDIAVTLVLGFVALAAAERS
jgi:hypothetical protein